MNALAPHDGAQRRRANFFRDTTREPNADVALDALKEQALTLVRASLEADALDNRRDLRPDDLDRMLSVAKGKLRGMSERELRGISASSASLKTLTDYSLSAAPAVDPRSPAALALAAERDKLAGADGGNSIAARLLRADMERAERIASSARYDGMGGSERLSHSDLQNMASARAAAMSLGMPWALNNPELLKLGAGAIKTLHEAGIQKERFERMTGAKVGFRAATAVDIAAFAKKHNLTPEQANQLFDKISNGVEIISGGNKAIQRELDEATRQYVTNPQAPDAKQKLEAAYLKHADTPEKKKAAETTTKALEEAAQRNATVVNKVEVKEVKAEAREKTTEDADLYAQAAVPLDPKSQPTKQANTDTPPPKDAAATKTAAVVSKPAAPKV